MADPSLAEVAQAQRRATLLSKAVDATEVMEHVDNAEMLELIEVALDRIYEVWEAARTLNKIRSGAGVKYLSDSVLVDPAAQTTAALAFARGERIHQLASFGVTLAYGEGAYGAGPYGGGWHWQEFPAGTDRLERREWYAEHVQGHHITPVLRVAEQFLVGEIARLT